MRIKYKSGNSWVAGTLPINVIEGANSTVDTYTVHNPAVISYLQDVNYTDDDDMSTSIVLSKRPQPGANYYRSDKPAGSSVTLPASGSYNVFDTTLPTHMVGTKSGTFNQDNLTPSNTGYYIHVVNNEIAKSGIFNPTGQIKMLNLSTTYSTYRAGNFRDLGGWTCDGGTIKYGKIIRGNRLNGGSVRCNESDKNILKNLLNVKDEIDLRSASEAKNTVNGEQVTITESALGSDVGYFHKPLNAYNTGTTVGTTSAGYYKDCIERIIEDLKANKTVYVHCVAGADRTGTLCAIIEAICGVPKAKIDMDYEMTSFMNVLISDGTAISTEYERPRTYQNYISFINYMKTFSGSTFRDKVITWCLAIGLSYDEINELRTLLIDGNPSPITPPVTTYTISSTLTHASLGNGATSIEEGQTYTSLVTPDSNYEVSTVTVTMGGTTVSGAYNTSTNTITVSNVTGNLVITVVATETVTTTYTISSTLTHVTLGNNAVSIQEGQTYTSTVTPDTGYNIDTVTVTMGGNTVQNAFDSTNNTITVTNVNGNLVINASATQPVVVPPNILEESFVSHGTTYPAVGYEDGKRISSSTGKTTADETCFATGFIPIVDGDVLTMKGMTFPEAASGDGKQYIGLYNSSEGKILTLTIRLNSDGSPKSFEGAYSIAKDTSSGTTVYTVTIDLGSYNGTDTTGAVYARFGIIGTGENATININV